MQEKIRYDGASRRFERFVDELETTLRFRPIVPEDRSLFEAGIRGLSDRSRYLRFFTGFKEAPPRILDLLSSVDGKRHVAWCALNITNEAETETAAAAAHAIMEPYDSDEADLAFAVIDDYQGYGIARMLIYSVAKDAFNVGLTRFRATVLAENHHAQHLMKHLGASIRDASGTTLEYEVSISTMIEKIEEAKNPAILLDFTKEFSRL
ncbi:GNAT family N-acetyltransferase [Kordiimonas sp. SCSIO 12610]|uniref:GNAT family N-acetyltransferase n=1 Tax=Kordiimonas sp. SCSIO 12610 TaxID=2829597 RepID=UPI00210A546F|nr:GNAT family N-acetyltransferase [Kordiimonas sp. SCSIO 12610]UTW56502.1 GNAT family N-acetyltransferase [Kordiimonas sp. SCSIO 12610]